MGKRKRITAAIRSSSVCSRNTSAVSYLSLGAARLDEDGEVSDLVRDLMQQDGEGGDGADRRTNQEGRSDRQAVSEVMREVGCQVQVPGHLDVCSREKK